MKKLSFLFIMLGLFVADHVLADENFGLIRRRNQLEDQLEDAQDAQEELIKAVKLIAEGMDKVKDISSHDHCVQTRLGSLLLKSNVEVRTLEKHYKNVKTLVTMEFYRERCFPEKFVITDAVIEKMQDYDVDYLTKRKEACVGQKNKFAFEGKTYDSRTGRLISNKIEEGAEHKPLIDL